MTAGTNASTSTKQQVLAMLEEQRGCSISGELLATQLQLSRNAIWKAIKDLQKDGHRITAAPNRGYCLCDDSDVLSVQGILPHLTPVVPPAAIFVHDQLESTNKTAKEMAIAGAAHGTLVIAQQQTAGKGRYGRDFHSPAQGGIYFSLILDPRQLPFDTPTLVTAFTAVCVCTAIEALTTKTPQIKWVNDLFLDGKKMCGILTEAVMDFESGTTAWIVVGIGINFSDDGSTSARDLPATAGFVFDAEKPLTTRNRLIAEIVNRLLSADISEKEVLAQYKQRMFLLGQRVRVTRSDEQFEALVLDIDDSGQLVIRTDDGQQLTLSAGEISIRAH
ncbi:MAG: biotin--[acetyl-CoA-carboxylase] ligase [Coriobacteriia bacterium]|nr:biotin--[acetyl-CoA-carboxylase] ligase [Coriobacteriia bacterium]